MADFLLELLSEEIPARMQDRAVADLARLFEAETAKAGLAAERIETFATPRRLAILVRGLPDATAAVSEETKGPRADAPAQAIVGFLGKTGLTREQLVERADAKGNAVLFAVREVPGRATADVLGEIVPVVARALPWPKSMRWGDASISTEAPRWVRPLQGVVALLDDVVVPCAVAGIAAGRETVGHRFMASGTVTIAHARDYADALQAARVVVDVEARRAIVRDGARAATAAAGLTLIDDEGLVAENAGLAEWPVPLLGTFDPAYLDVPREVIQLTMRTNQKYFACVDADGALAPAFVCTANIEATDGGAAIVAGNAKVLAARLADARFFWDQDLRVPLEEQAKKLDQIVFHEKLGTVADKVARVAKLARWLVEEGIVGDATVTPAKAGVHSPNAGSSNAASMDPDLRQDDEGRKTLADLAEQAALLCKADLVTGMVGEFPELQGVMGGYYARTQGLPDAVADAIRDHYKPVGQGDEVPTAPVTVAVSLADKLDTIVSYFRLGEVPSGSRDPYALRRSALAIISLIEANFLRLGLNRAIEASLTGFRPQAFKREVRSNSLIQELDIKLPIENLTVETRRTTLEREGGTFFQANGREYGPFVRNAFEGLFERISVWHISNREDEKVVSFFADRLKVQQREAGVRHDLIGAVFALGGEDDLVRLLARVKALQAFVETGNGANLLAGYRRAAKILRKEGVDPAASATRHPELVSGSIGASSQVARMDADLRQHDERGTAFSYDPEPAEAALVDAIETQLPLVAAAIEAERFADAMAALAALRAPIDAFFDTVTVNDPDPERRTARLALLARLVAAMHNVADFSKIEG